MTRLERHKMDPPDPHLRIQHDKVARLKDMVWKLAVELGGIPPCHEKNLAITKLEEASMWATKAVLTAPWPPEPEPGPEA